MNCLFTAKCPESIGCVQKLDGSRIKILHLLAYKAVCVLFAFTMPMCGCSKPQESQTSRYRSEAKLEMGKYCTNMVGFSRMNSIFLLDWTEDLNTTANPAFWSGTAEVDYINKVGGVERTNINFHFKIETNIFLASDDKTEVRLDYMPWIKEDSERERVKFEEWLKSLKSK